MRLINLHQTNLNKRLLKNRHISAASKKFILKIKVDGNESFALMSINLVTRNVHFIGCLDFKYSVSIKIDRNDVIQSNSLIFLFC